MNNRKAAPPEIPFLFVKKIACIGILALCFDLVMNRAHGQAKLLADIDYSEEVTYNEYSDLTSGKRRLFFIAHDSELWTSTLGVDDTEDTRFLKRFKSISDLTLIGSLLYFVADDGFSGAEVWKSNGTDAPGGTVKAKDIRPGSLGSAPQSLTNVNGTLFFSAHDGQHG